MGLPKSAAPWVRTIRDLVFPPSCISCGGLCEKSPLHHVCQRCVPLITHVRAPHCLTCGHPFFGEMEGERICPHCEGLLPAYQRAKTVTLFKGPSREMVLTLKYQHGLHVLEDMVTLIRRNQSVCEFIGDATLVPVPLHPRKEREREYNQSKFIAEAFQEATGGGAKIADLLERTQDSESQTVYDRRTRRQRMKNAFAARKQAAITAHDRYMLVDDVFTTGSTLNACAVALSRAGAVNIDVVTFAHG